MPPDSSLQASPPVEVRSLSDRLWSLVVRLLVIVMILVLLPGLLMIVEMGIPLEVHRRLPAAIKGDVTLYILRGATYLALFAAAAWAVHRFSRPQRKRLYWILLGIGALIMVPPTGAILGVFTILMIFTRRLF
ncbi:MAG: hypothetical protein VW600_12200 [Ferrovibrio sp.]